MASQLRRSGRAGHDLLVAGEGQHGTGGVRHVRSIVCRVPRIADAFAAAPGSGPYRRQGRRRVPAAMASRTLTCSARPWDIRARATPSCTPSICWSSTARTWCSEPWDVRRATLRSLLRRTRQGIRFSEHLICPDGTIAFHHACRMGLKGVVAKREIGLTVLDWVTPLPSCPAGKRPASGSRPRTRRRTGSAAAFAIGIMASWISA